MIYAVSVESADENVSMEHSSTFSHYLQVPKYGGRLLERLNEMRSRRQLTDVVLCVDSNEFYCHRAVLSATSSYFGAMFSSRLREEHEERIVLKEMKSGIIEKIIDFAYTGSLDILVEDALELLSAANLFNLPDVIDACCSFLTEQLHPTNCLGMEEFAHLHSCVSLEHSAHQFALENFSSVVESDEFLHLTPTRLRLYLVSDLIEVRTEEFVFEALQRWLGHNPAVKKETICPLMECVRFATMDKDYVSNDVLNSCHVTECIGCTAYVNNSRNTSTDESNVRQQRRLSVQAASVPRPSTVAKQVMVLVGGFGRTPNIIQSLELYEPHKDKWNVLTIQPPSTPLHCSITAVGNDIYVTGGSLDGHITSRVWKFISSKRCWLEAPPMLSARAHHTSTACRGKLFVVGGIRVNVDGSTKPAESIECLDVAKQVWGIAGELPCPRSQSQLASYHDTLVEVGGLQCGIPVATMESYRCCESSVVYSGEQFVLPELIQFAKVVVLGDVLYIIWEDSKRMISLDPAKRTFKRLADMQYMHKHGGATVLCEKIYVVGGLTDQGPSNIVECYDPATDTWSTVKTMQGARAFHGCVSIQMC